MAKNKAENAQPQQDAEEPKPERYSRLQAARKVVGEMDGEASLKELTAKACALIEAGGGTFTPENVEGEVWGVLETAEALGMVELVFSARRLNK